MTHSLSFRLLTAAICATVLITACEKEKVTTLDTPAERILGDWSIVQEEEHHYTAGTSTYLHSDTIVIPVNIFEADFRTDGKVYFTRHYPGSTEYDTATYTINDTLLIVNGANYAINKFTGDSLVTTDKYNDNTDDIVHILTWIR